MNSVNLVGRLTKDPDLRYTNDGKAVAKFTLAIDRYKSEADFIRCVAFGARAEALANYMSKGKQLGVTGSIKTGSYDDKESGKKVFTTEVIADRFDFPSKQESGTAPRTRTDDDDLTIEDFKAVGDDEDLPF